MRKGEKLARKLIKKAEMEAKLKTQKESEVFLDRWLGRNNYLRQMFDQELAILKRRELS